MFVSLLISMPNNLCMQPDITFFGEDLPDEFGRRLVHHDRELADLVIVIGTSLKVAPVAEVPGILPRNIPQIYISRTVRPFNKVLTQTYPTRIEPELT